jgi:hypothetical protein
MLLLLALACSTPAPVEPTPAPAAAVANTAPPAEAPTATTTTTTTTTTTVGRDDAKWKYFGDAFTVASSVPASQVLTDPARHASGAVRMTGEFTQVCQKMGCWAVVRDDQGHTVRITMKDHAFGIDKDAVGKACDIEGTLVSKKVDPAQLAHYEEEGAKDHPEAGKAEAWELVASSVAIAR